jgi:cysteine desulfurase
MSIYLDNSATTPVCPEAAEAALEAMTVAFGNPSSTYLPGRQAKKALDKNRAAIASALGCTAEELFFTSCGSESDNWAIIRGAEYNRRRGKHVISSKTEHDAVLKSLSYLETEGFEVTLLDPQQDGSVSVSDVEAALREDTCLVSLMLVNNETGAVNDIAAVSAMLRRTGSRALLHSDAVQAFMKLPFSAKALGADMISISGHKIHAPKGIGALYIRKGLNLPPYIHGGGQERGKRAGTEATAQIAAFAAAVEAAKRLMPEYTARMAALREHAVSRLTTEIDGLRVIGGGAPHILSISIPGQRSETLMNWLEAREIYVSKSSACKKGGRSHVLEAMALPAEVIDGALRISFSRFTTLDEVDALCTALAQAKAELRTSVRR